MELTIDKDVHDYLLERDHKDLLIYLPDLNKKDYYSEIPEIQVESLKKRDKKIESKCKKIQVDGINIFVEKNLVSKNSLRVYKVLSIPNFMTVIGVTTEH